MKYNPWPYQQYTEDRIVADTCGPLLDMGLGKTVATLTAMARLIKAGEVKRVLVIAPLRIADEVWSAEVQKWDHLRHLKLSKVLGTETKRKKALLYKADIYIINRENVAWLVAYYAGAFPFDAVILDESSSFKDPSSRRFKALRQVAPLIKRKYILTGTPIPNGLLGIWSQKYFLDRGAALGESYAMYRQKYFEADKRDRYMIHSYKLRQGDELLGADIFEAEIHQKIADQCFSMKASDYLDLPERFDLTREVSLNPADHQKYLDFERDQVLALKSGEDITALTAAALTNKLLQYANGAVYDEDKKYHVVHDTKLEVLEEMVEGLDGQPVLIFYSYRHDLERMKQKLKSHKPMHLQTSQDIQAWNASKIAVMLAHPASAGHGLNLQDGGNHIFWYGLPWSLELYQQANARLHRQGQIKPVYIHKLITKGTMDEDVERALQGKTTKQDALMDAVKALVEKYR
jgi:SNF2 family DNA or RNA helicase